MAAAGGATALGRLTGIFGGYVTYIWNTQLIFRILSGGSRRSGGPWAGECARARRLARLCVSNPSPSESRPSESRPSESHPSESVDKSRRSGGPYGQANALGPDGSHGARAGVCAADGRPRLSAAGGDERRLGYRSLRPRSLRPDGRPRLAAAGGDEGRETADRGARA